MFKRWSYLFFVFLLCAGCMGGMIKQGVTTGIESTPVGGEFLIHSNPKPGDYAVYKKVGTSSNSVSGTLIEVYTAFTDRYEVTDVNDNEIIVRMESTGEFAETKVNGQTSKKAEKDEIADNIGIAVSEYYLDKKGMIKKVRYINEKLGIDTMFKQASPGGEGYIMYTSGKQNIEIKTDAGKFRTNPVYYSLKTSSEMKTRYVDSDVKSTVYNITYVNPNIKFRKVSSLSVFTGDIKTAIDNDKMVSDVTSVLSLTNFVLNPTSLVSGAKNILDYAKSSPLPGKESLLKSVTEKDETILKGLNSSMVETLVEQGHKNIN